MALMIPREVAGRQEQTGLKTLTGLQMPGRKYLLKALTQLPGLGQISPHQQYRRLPIYLKSC
jgi:hypothetical protein